MALDEALASSIREVIPVNHAPPPDITISVLEPPTPLYIKLGGLIESKTKVLEESIIIKAKAEGPPVLLYAVQLTVYVLPVYRVSFMATLPVVCVIPFELPTTVLLNAPPFKRIVALSQQEA